jgi:hypothetical protein
MSNSPFNLFNTSYNKKKTIIDYLQSNFDVDIESIELFLKFLGKNLHEKKMLYENSNIQLYKINDIFFESEFSSEEETSIKRNSEYYNIPDIDFENQMMEEFDIFKNKLRDDNQNYLYYNTHLDDFYRLFARFYNPVF